MADLTFNKVTYCNFTKSALCQKHFTEFLKDFADQNLI